MTCYKYITSVHPYLTGNYLVIVTYSVILSEANMFGIASKRKINIGIDIMGNFSILRLHALQLYLVYRI